MNDDDKERMLKTFSPRVQQFLKNAEKQREEDLLFAAQTNEELENLGKKLDSQLARFEQMRRVHRTRELTEVDKKDFRAFMAKVLPQMY